MKLNVDEKNVQSILYIYKLHFLAISATSWVTAAWVCAVYMHVIESDDIAISTNTSLFYKLHEGS